MQRVFEEQTPRLSMSGKLPPEGEGPKPGGQPPAFSQEFQHANVGARVPERVARGVFSTGALVLQEPSEFVLDFVLRMNQPQQVVARVVLPVGLMPRLIEALRENLERYKQTFGPPPTLPVPPPPPKPPTIQEIYDNLKVADDVLSGSYANQVLVAHSASEFCFEFITTFYPKAAVSSRVFLSAPQVPVLLNTLTQSWQTYQAKLQHQQHPPKPPQA
jgi:hypothetical protein